MMKNKIYLTTVLFVLYCFNGIYGQVTIGNNVKPEPFSIVQVEGEKGGVRLPQLTKIEMDELAVTLKIDNESSGLVVFNTTDNMLSFWDGEKWCVLITSLGGDNGITTLANSSGVELGGNLIKNTEINQKGFDFNIQDASATRKLSIGNMDIDGSKVAMNPTNSVSVNSILTADIPSNSTTINTNKLSVNDGVFVMEDGKNMAINGLLQYSTGAKSGDVLTSDAEGNVSWQPSRPFGSIVEGALIDGTSDNHDAAVFANTGANLGVAKNITSTSLKLTPGQWIIFAKCVAQCRTTTMMMYHWMHLWGNTVDQPWPWADSHYITRTGINPEFKTSMDSRAYSTPSLMYYVNIPKTTYYRIAMSTSNNVRDRTTNEFGGSYFFAIKIDAYDPNLPSN